MTQDEIIHMAREAGVSIRGHYDETGSTPQELERFAALVAAHEREKQAEQEPVAWAISHSLGLEFGSKYPMQETKEAAEQMARQHMGAVVVTPLYTTPPQPKAEQQEPELDLEIFCDPSYFDMWCVRDPVIKDFNHTIHVNSKEHALHTKAVIEDWVKKYASPPQREWVEPSDEQIGVLWRNGAWQSMDGFARAVLKLAKELNS